MPKYALHKITQITKPGKGKLLTIELAFKTELWQARIIKLLKSRFP